MARFLLVRLVRTLVVLWGVTTAVFWLIHLSGDPVALLVPLGTPVADIQRLRHELGFDQPLTVQYLLFMQGVVRGDFGRSIIYGQPAFEVISARLPATIELAVISMLLALATALPIGIVSATRPGTLFDRIAMGSAVVAQATPTFLIGIVLILVLSVQLHLLPTGGSGDWNQVPMPAVTLALVIVPTLARITRSEMIQVLQQDYIRTARAKGQSRIGVAWHHALKNAALPIVTVTGLLIGYLLGGAVVVETVFSWPGVGQLAVQSISYRDYPVVQTIVLLGALWFVLANTTADIVCAAIDPRTRR